MEKARVALVKTATTPRLELTSAAISVQYNRVQVQTKCEETFPPVRRYDENSHNPADDASPLKEHKLSREHRWITSPSFLSLPNTGWPLLPCDLDDISVEDLEVKTVVVHSMEIPENDDRLSRL